MLARRAHPEMTQIEQERDAMLFRGDWIVGGWRIDAEALDRQLETAGRAPLFAHHAGHLERGLLPEVIGCGERLRADLVQQRDALAHPGAVAQQQKMDLAARAAIIEPSLERHFLAHVTAERVDIDPGHDAI